MIRGTAPDSTEIDRTTSTPARLYEYLSGGPRYFAIDAKVGSTLAAGLPEGDGAALVAAQRAFLAAAVEHFLAAGIWQFLDIEADIPHGGSTHRIAQAQLPAARVAYVGRDPIVTAFAHRLRDSIPEGAATYTPAGLADPVAVLDAARTVLDLDLPVAVLLIGTLQHVPNRDRPDDAVAEVVAELAPGSAVAVSHFTDDSRLASATGQVAGDLSEPFVLRDSARIERFVAGLEPIETSTWHNAWAGDRALPVHGVAAHVPSGGGRPRARSRRRATTSNGRGPT